MSERTIAAQPKATAPLSPSRSSVLQRQCACGTHTSGGGQCAECSKKKLGLQRKLMIGASYDPLEQEADRIADQMMATPVPTANSGAPLRIQRISGQPNGQMDAAPASVDQALAGPGRPLEPALRQDMEQRFGHDFSRVQIHSDGAAEQSARDVRARAYTVGHDMVFGAGRFAPGTGEGRRLIAHELTHVVQQSASEGIPTAATRHVLARKAEVDLPGWGSPGVGDDDSDVTFTPLGDFRTRQFERDMAALAKADPLAQFAQEQVGLKAGEWAHSEMQERGGYSGTLEIKAGKKGIVEIAVRAHFYFDEKWDSRYDQVFSCSWAVEADLQGKLKIGKPRPQITPIGDDEAPFQLAALNADQDADGGSVQISPQFNSYQFTDIPNVSVGGQDNDSGASGGVTFGNEQTFPPGVLVRTFSLDLKVIDIPAPTGSVLIGPISYQNSRMVLFDPPKKGKGQHTVSPAQREGLIFWYRHLSEETRTQVQEGAIPISLEGHASTTGDTGMNLGLSSRRIDSVKEILGPYLGNLARFEYRALGEYDAKTPDDTESEEERALIVSVWEETFKGESTP